VTGEGPEATEPLPGLLDSGPVKEGDAMADGVLEMRLVVTADDYEAALAFYRDVLGLRELGAYSTGDRRVTILEAGRATLELADPPHAAWIDEIEVGRRVAGHVRVAFQVPDTAAATRRLVDAGATLVGAPVETPWRSLNARLEAPAGLQLTLFEQLADRETFA
jgi:lactoylglutathione lyase